MKWTGTEWIPENDNVGGGDNDWNLVGDVLKTGGEWGLARIGNVLYGDWDSTHVNLGVACTTGAIGANDWYVTVGGGIGNCANGCGATISGGNRNYAYGDGSIVDGGTINIAIGTGSVVGGGSFNSSKALNATVGGGNVNQATGSFSTIAGGQLNETTDTLTTIAGGVTNYAGRKGASIGGGGHNRATGYFSVVAGGGGGSYYDSNAAAGDWSAIVGGYRNVATAEGSLVGGGRENLSAGSHAVVGGGQDNQALGAYSFIGGGWDNEAQDQEVTIAGGSSNTARSRYSTIGGGSLNETDGPPGFHACAVVGGGHQNKATNQYATVAGGGYNHASGQRSSIGGGLSNLASDTAAVVCGGGNNYARGEFSVVVGGGGDYSTTLDSNAALGGYSFVGGGKGNVAAGDFATVPGGQANEASGSHSMAAGNGAKATHEGSFVWNDNAGLDFTSDYTNEFAIHATNGFRAEAENTHYGAWFSNYSGGDGLRAYANTSAGDIWGAVYASNAGSSPAISAHGSKAGYFGGAVEITGWLTKPAGSFKIDHPLDPENKYLYHSFVESPDMKNIYDGIVTLDESGEGWVELPEWFEALNRDFRYQITCIGGYAPVFIAEKLADNRFKVAGGTPGLEVSWQITGIRQDAFANAHRIPVEANKSEAERGLYLHPGAFGQPESKGVGARERAEKLQRSATAQSQ